MTRRTARGPVRMLQEPTLDEPLVLAGGSLGPDRSVPVRPADLVRRLRDDPSLDPAGRLGLGRFSRLLRSLYHARFHDRLLELKDLYAPLDPDTDCVEIQGASRRLTDSLDEEFLRPFETTLLRANYRLLGLDEVERAVLAPNEIGLNYVPDFGMFEHLKIYVRGRTTATRQIRNLATGFRKKAVVLDAYRRMVVALKFKDHKKLGPFVRSDRLYLRMFKDVPYVDMEMHLPVQGTKVVMRPIDKAQIASPLVVGLPTFAFKLLRAFPVGLFAVGAVLAAPVTAGVNSFFGFQRAKQNHLHYRIRNLYYLSVANNAAVIDSLVGSAEEAEFKEALLAYAALWKHRDDPEPWDQARLDRHVEAFLNELTGLTTDFEVGDAVGKLVRLGLVRQSPQGVLSPVPMEQALAVLDSQRDDLFRFHEPRAPSRNGSATNC